MSADAYTAPTGTVWEWRFKKQQGDVMLMLDGHVQLMMPSMSTGELEPWPFRRYFSLLRGRVYNFGRHSLVNANAWPVL